MHLCATCTSVCPSARTRRSFADPTRTTTTFRADSTTRDGDAPTIAADHSVVVRSTATATSPFRRTRHSAHARRAQRQARPVRRIEAMDRIDRNRIRHLASRPRRSGKFIFLSSGRMPSASRQLVEHFRTQGTPVMIGGGALVTLLGRYDVERGTSWHLDPHYTGPDDLATTVEGTMLEGIVPSPAVGGHLSPASLPRITCISCSDRRVFRTRARVCVCVCVCALHDFRFRRRRRRRRRRRSRFFAIVVPPHHRPQTRPPVPIAQKRHARRHEKRFNDERVRPHREAEHEAI